jgi:hypothetical protein
VNGKAPECQTVEEAEHASRGANSKRHDQNHRGGERRRPPQQSDRIGGVLGDILEPDRNPCRPRILPRKRDVAHQPPAFDARIRRRQP